MLMLAGGFSSCAEREGNNFSELVEIPFTEYSLNGTGCWWKNTEPDKIIVINSNKELEKYVVCEDGSCPEIDFSKYSLLLVLIKDVEGCNIDSNVEKLSLWQLSVHKYEFSVDIIPSDTANAMPLILNIAIITEKLSGKGKIELNVTIIKN